MTPKATELAEKLHDVIKEATGYRTAKQLKDRNIYSLWQRVAEVADELEGREEGHSTKEFVEHPSESLPRAIRGMKGRTIIISDQQLESWALSVEAIVDSAKKLRSD